MAWFLIIFVLGKPPINGGVSPTQGACMEAGERYVRLLIENSKPFVYPPQFQCAIGI